MEYLVVGGGDAVLFHEVFGKDLAGLDAGGLGVRAEAGDARFVEGVHAAQGQRIVRGHHGEVHLVLYGKVHDGADILGPDLGHAHGVGGDAAVAGQGVDGLHLRVFPELFDDGVLAATAAHDQKFHSSLLLLSCSPAREAGKMMPERFAGSKSVLQ